MLARLRGPRRLSLVTLVLFVACTPRVRPEEPPESRSGAQPGARSSAPETEPVTNAPGPPGKYCEILFDRAIACASPEEQKNSQFEVDLYNSMEICFQSAREPEEEEAYLACAAKSSCDEYRRCRSAVNDKLWALRIERTIEDALQRGERMDSALSHCNNDDIRDAAVKKQCGDVYKKALEAGTKELEDVRDAGDATYSSIDCDEHEDTAARVSPEAKRKAEALCKEVNASEEARGALHLAKWFFNDDRLEMPFECDRAAEALAALSASWAKTKLQEVLKHCYIDLGRKILQARVGKMRICEESVQQVYRAVKKYDLKDAVLTPWIARAKQKCE
ncbi:hypothetical protein [Nannocystis radixulma]|uniref:Secreted protein n=1 Tax=Nannocystis radixulma TaxID=2995305 RepID=A0ABT5AWP9_9BACT|nr:hypothetical protein [Nannocystis radixulma]MDC0666251.1 hypothetical protein [Nannocystis radixulma]